MWLFDLTRSVVDKSVATSMRDVWLKVPSTIRVICPFGAHSENSHYFRRAPRVRACLSSCIGVDFESCGAMSGTKKCAE